MTASNKYILLFAGGGTGGHIFPNVAIAEAVQQQSQEQGGEISPHFLISDRALDAAILQAGDWPYTVLRAAPLSVRPDRFVRFAMGFQRSLQTVRSTIQQVASELADHEPVMIATGGFVCGPAVAAARSLGVRTAMVNLDAIAGKANRMLAHRVDTVFSCYPSAKLPGGRGHEQRHLDAQTVSYPVRQAARATVPQATARRRLGLDPQRPTLLVTAGSQGALTINQMMRQLAASPRGRSALNQWQVLHLSGQTMVDALREGYAAANIPAVVEPFLDQMGLAWSAATLAISRSGAGAVGEAWANAVPCVFFPYPFHRDQHQKANAKPLTDRGAAVLCPDLKNAESNVHQLLPILHELTRDEVRLGRMQQILRQSRPEDGARRVARWILTGM